MKRISILGFLLQFRSYVENTYELISKISDRVGSIEGMISNHIMHRLDTHEEMIKEIHEVVVGERNDTADGCETKQGDQ